MDPPGRTPTMATTIRQHLLDALLTRRPMPTSGPASAPYWRYTDLCPAMPAMERQHRANDPAIPTMTWCDDVAIAAI